MQIKEKVQSNFWRRYLISELHCLESWLMPKLFGDEREIKRKYKRETGKELNLEEPETFSEKMQWYKLRYCDPLMQRCADKINVRSYIQERGCGDCLNELYGIYHHVREINLDGLPDKFVLKAAHGSNMNIIVKDKTTVNWLQQRMMLHSWLGQDIFWSRREWVYKGLPKRIIAERYLEDETGELRDYKFFCFHGKPTYMQLEIGRFGNYKVRNFYDMEWNLMPFSKATCYNPKLKVEKPYKFEKMKEIAERLSKPFPFVRVDLYQAEGKIYFGELTFFPAGGAADFQPEEYDKIVGKHWNIDS